MTEDNGRSKKGWEVFLAFLGAVFSTVLGVLIPQSSNSTAPGHPTGSTGVWSDFFTISANIFAPLLTIAFVLFVLTTLSLILRLLDIFDIFDSDFWDWFH